MIDQRGLERDSPEMSAQIEFLLNREGEIQNELNQAAFNQDWRVYNQLKEERKRTIADLFEINPDNPRISEKERTSLLKDEADRLTKKNHSKFHVN